MVVKNKLQLHTFMQEALCNSYCFVCSFQLWENAINCWTDLQHYRELFYQDGLDPYRVQREAQVSTKAQPQGYLCL